MPDSSTTNSDMLNTILVQARALERDSSSRVSHHHKALKAAEADLEQARAVIQAIRASEEARKRPLRPSEGRTKRKTLPRSPSP